MKTVGVGLLLGFAGLGALLVGWVVLYGVAEETAVGRYVGDWLLFYPLELVLILLVVGQIAAWAARLGGD